MEQNNNCLRYKSNSCDVQEESILVMEGSNSASKRYPSRRPRLRSAFDIPAPLEEEEGVILKQNSPRRRISDPVLSDRELRPRRGSLEQFFARYAPTSRRRRASLQTTFEGTELPHNLSSHRKSPPLDGKRSVLRNFRSLYGRSTHSEDDQAQPSQTRKVRSTHSEDYQAQPSQTRKVRKRSASLGQVIVSMAHHKLRTSGSHSPDPRRAVEKKTQEETAQPQNTQNSESEIGHHQPACVESLIKRCASCFDKNGECLSSDFPRILFLTHPWFMTSEQLAVLFSQLYEDENTPTEMKKQVFFAIRYWMKEFPHMFDLDAALVEVIKDLQTVASADDQVDTSLIDLSNRGNYRWMKPDRLSVRPPQGTGRKRRKVSLVFHHLEPEELAIHLSYLELKCFKRLMFDDFREYALHATIKDIARLERSVFLFNNITFWVQCMVLGQHTPQERAAVITKYIKIAQKLREMRNYNTLIAIVGGLTHTAIARLKKTMSALTKDSVKALDELMDLLDSRGNYIAYRRDYAQQHSGFKIPILGVHMKDIISVHTAMHDRVGDGLINVKKMMSIGATFQELLNLQRTPFPYEVNKDLVNTLRVSLYLYYTEEEIYALSLHREPRDAKNSVSSANSPSKMNNMVFAEFTKFTCQLDSDTVKQHVTAMVKSVFKAYDHDNDGFISEEDFDSFKDNFPMMESFSAMDVDRDGRISHSEMCEYFMKASAFRRNDFCQNFTHVFTEATYFHPTFCQECEKLLWGLVKQGWKCKGCGINCHKHCKDRIVQECRPKQHASQQSNGHPSNTTLSSLKRNGTREKSSVSSESDLSANGDVLTAIVSSTSQSLVLEDEAFDSPSELIPLVHRHVSPFAMRRSTSLASTDAPSVSLLRQVQDNRTPPPVRKVGSSPNQGNGGRKSLQHKMQKLMLGLNNSNKSRNSTDSATQTPPHSPSMATTPHYASAKSFLYPKATDTPKIFHGDHNRSSGGRLGSTGEEIEDGHLSHLNNNHVLPRVMQQVARSDSGLSGCSYERSFPLTPVMLSKLQTGNRENLQGNAFRFPPFSCEDTVPHNTQCHESASTLKEENTRLRESNVQLQKQLEETKDYVKLLEDKLKQSGLDLPTESGLKTEKNTDL